MSLLGRTTGILRTGLQVFRRHASHASENKVSYRELPKLQRWQIFQPNLLGGFMWFWILWHTWHEPDAILGHFPWPDASAWTNEELGIPPDDEE